MKLEASSPMVGEYNEDGSIKRRPARFVNGRDIPAGRGVTTLRVSQRYFVALPPGYVGEVGFEISVAPEVVAESKEEEAVVPPVPMFRRNKGE